MNLKKVWKSNVKYWREDRENRSKIQNEKDPTAMSIAYILL